MKNQLLTLLRRAQLEVSLEVGRDERLMHPVLSNQGLLGKEETVDSVDQAKEREMFIQCKIEGFKIVVLDTNYALAVEIILYKHEPCLLSE